MSRPIVLVSGALANKPGNGGNAWTRLSWVLGFRRLGFDVYFVEQIASGSCVDRSGQPASFETSENLAYFRSTMRAFGLDRSSTLLLDNGQRADGVPLDDLRPLASRAAFLFNISGHLTHPELLDRVEKKIYFDDDPGFTQFWHASGTDVRLAGHDHFFTIGENIGQPDCPIPVGDIPWRHTRCPVVLDQWPAKDLVSSREPLLDRFTTVSSWRGPYGPITFGGRTYGLKVHQFRKFIELPRRLPHKFEIALDIHPADEKDLDALIAEGWQIAPPRAVADSLQSFRTYVQNSGAEFSVAQGVYVDTNSGWFSDRTVRYLASSRPALVQETGFSRHLPTGEGLLAFRTLDEALAGADRIAADYKKHCRAARQIAEDYFDSDKIITRLLSDIAVLLPADSKVSMTATSTIKRLNWGCGSWRPQGWINSDIKEAPGIDLTCDILKGMPLESDSLDYAVGIHALPEMNYPDLVPALEELRRVLKPGGVLRLALPDIDRGFDAYRRGDSKYFLIPDEDAKSIGAKFVTQMLWYGYSKLIFTRDFIEEMLYKARFSRVDHCSFKETKSPWAGIVELDNREQESLFVEAVK